MTLETHQQSDPNTLADNLEMRRFYTDRLRGPIALIGMPVSEVEARLTEALSSLGILRLGRMQRLLLRLPSLRFALQRIGVCPWMPPQKSNATAERRAEGASGSS